MASYYNKPIHSAPPERHRAVYDLFLQLRSEKQKNSPIEAKYLGVSYYADVISQNPLIGLNKNTIVRIINSFVKGLRK